MISPSLYVIYFNEFFLTEQKAMLYLLVSGEAQLFVFLALVFLNQDYVIGFVIACPVFTGSVAIARKSDCLEVLAQRRYGEIENSNEVADFKAISARNRMSIAYFGLNLVENISLANGCLFNPGLKT